MQTADAQRTSDGTEAKTIRAIRIHAYGGPEGMRLEEIPMPVLRAGQALIRIHAASVNFLDVQKRRGELGGQSFYHRKGAAEPDLPTILGSQGVGVVEAIGPEVSNVAVGDRVSFAGESYASHALVPAVRLIRIPEGISFEQAAAGMNQGFLAYAFTHFAYPVKAGDWCLIQAAAGGLGLLLCQMAKIRGGRVVGVISTAEKAGSPKKRARTLSSSPHSPTSRRKRGKSRRTKV